MKNFRVSLGEHAWFTGYLHDQNPIRQFPTLLILPGGAFRTCSPREGEPVAMAFFAEGYNCLVLDYTTVTKKPDASITDPMKDVEVTLQWINDNSETYGLNRRVAMIGFSGGGHLAASVATHGPLRPDLLILGYPGILHSDLRALECPDIVESVDRLTPPAFIFSTRDDTVTPPKHPLAFAHALNQFNIPFELHIFDHGVHGLSLGKEPSSAGRAEMLSESFAQWFPMCIRWLKSNKLPVDEVPSASNKKAL